MSAREIRYTAILQLEIDIPEEVIATLGESQAILEWAECHDAATLVRVVEATCGECGSSMPHRCMCVADAYEEDAA